MFKLNAVHADVTHLNGLPYLKLSVLMVSGLITVHGCQTIFSKSGTGRYVETPMANTAPSHIMVKHLESLPYSQNFDQLLGALLSRTQCKHTLRTLLEEANDIDNNNLYT